MAEGEHRIVILSDQPQQRQTYRQYLTNGSDSSFQIGEMSSGDFEQEVSPEIADCVLIVQSRHGNEPRLLKHVFLTQNNAPGMIFVLHPETLADNTIQFAPHIELLTPDEASPYRLVHIVRRLLERREIVKRIEEYAERLFDAQEILEQLWNDIVGPAILFDTHGVVKRVNTSFLNLTQAVPDTFVGRDYLDFLPSMDENLFQERLQSILEEGSGTFWTGQFAADRQPQYPLRFSARRTGKKESASRFMVLVEPELTEQAAPATPPSTLMQTLHKLMQGYDARMSQEAVYEHILKSVQEMMQAQGAIAFSLDASKQMMHVEMQDGVLPAWLLQTENHTQGDYLFRDALAEQQIKVFKLAAAPQQKIAMLITLPIIIQQHIWGAICIAFEKVREISGDERSFLGLAACWVAQTFEHRQQLLQANTASFLQDRNDILPLIAHELRTPLTVLMGYTQLLQRRLRTGSILEERNMQALHTILDRAQRVDATLETLIELAHIDMGVFSIQVKPLNVAALLREVLLVLRKQTAHTLMFDGVDQAIVMGDEERLRRVFTSIIHNAIVYSPSSEMVSVIVDLDQNTVRITVIDHGQGIHSDQLGDVFTRFSHVRSEQTIGGMGVSLYLARKIIEAHEGTITMTSIMGQGSQVIIDLPRMLA